MYFRSKKNRTYRKQRIQRSRKLLVNKIDILLNSSSDQTKPPCTEECAGRFCFAANFLLWILRFLWKVRFRSDCVQGLCLQIEYDGFCYATLLLRHVSPAQNADRPVLCHQQQHSRQTHEISAPFHSLEWR